MTTELFPCKSKTSSDGKSSISRFVFVLHALSSSYTGAPSSSPTTTSAHNPFSMHHASLSSFEMPRKSLWARTKRHLREDIQTDFLLESELISLTFATGIIDAASFP